MDEYQGLLDAYRILSGLFSQAWAQPAEIPTPVALMLLHAREHIGAQIGTRFCFPRPPEG